MKPLPERGFLFLLYRGVPEMALSVENDTVCRFLHSGGVAPVWCFRHSGNPAITQPVRGGSTDVEQVLNDR